MPLFNQHWIGMDGEPIAGRVPTQMFVPNGQELTAQQQGAVFHAYKLFCDAVSGSAFPGGYHVQNRRFPDGTTVRMESIGGVHKVLVRPAKTPSQESVRLPTGIVVNINSVSLAYWGSYPYWGSARVLPITAMPQPTPLPVGVKPAKFYPGTRMWAGGQSASVLITVDDRTALDPDQAYQRGQVKFHLVPNSAFTNGAPDENHRAGELAVWYYGDGLTFGCKSWNFPDSGELYEALGLSASRKIKLFFTHGFDPIKLLNTGKAHGVAVFFVQDDSTSTYEVFSREISDVGPVNGGARYATKLLAAATATTSIAEWPRDLMRSSSNITGATTYTLVGAMYDGEPLNSFSVTVPAKSPGEGYAVSAQVSLVGAATPPPDPDVGDMDYQATMSVTYDFPPTWIEGIHGPCLFMSGRRTVTESWTRVGLVNGVQDPWTFEWTRLPTTQTLVLGRTLESWHEGGTFDADNAYWAGGSLRSRESISISATSSVPAYSYGFSQEHSYVGPIVGGVLTNYSWSSPAAVYVAPAAPVSRDELRMIDEDYGPKRSYAMIHRCSWVTSFAGGQYSNSGVSSSLTLRIREPQTDGQTKCGYNDVPLIPDLHAYFVEASGTGTPLHYAGGASGMTGAGRRVDFKHSWIMFDEVDWDEDPMPPPGVPWDRHANPLPYSLEPGTRVVGPVSNPPVDIPLIEAGLPGPFTGFNLAKTYYGPTELSAYMDAVNASSSARDDLVATSVNSITLVYTPFGVMNTAPGGLYTESLIGSTTPHIGAAHTNRVYIDKRNMTFLTQFAGWGATFWTGSSPAETTPLLRQWIGNKFGAVPFLPIFNAWLADHGYATFEEGEIFINYGQPDHVVNCPTI